MKSEEERIMLFEKLEVDLTKDITVYCQTGVTASVLYASLYDIAEGKLSLYDGSWSEFSDRRMMEKLNKIG